MEATLKVQTRKKTRCQGADEELVAAHGFSCRSKKSEQTLKMEASPGNLPKGAPLFFPFLPAPGRCSKEKMKPQGIFHVFKFYFGGICSNARKFFSGR